MGAHSLSPSYTPGMEQQGMNGGLFDLGLLNEFSNLGGADADYPGKLQGALGQQQLPNGLQDGALSGLSGADLDAVGIGGSAFGNGALANNLTAKLNGFAGGGTYPNGLNGGGYPNALNGVNGTYGNGGQANGDDSFLHQEISICDLCAIASGAKRCPSILWAR